MVKTPVNGMKDILPNEMKIRQYLLSKLRKIYTSFGFFEIETPTIEHIENLLSNQGWENEKLIFKIQKRGDKLKKAIDENKLDELCDCGLRYDLTLPLCRYYTNNRNQFNGVFKAMQFGNVYRADRPQKGRYRQFMQCDIDIFNEQSYLAEIELFLATYLFLNEIFNNDIEFYFEINDRRLLKCIFEYCNFNDKYFDDICIMLDKIDKVSFDDVKQEMIEKGYNKDSIDKLSYIYNSFSNVNREDIFLSIDVITQTINTDRANDIKNNLKEIIDICKSIENIKFRYNPFLVRGMGYYTSTIFEIKSNAFNGSIGGGGRYDEMVYKFIGEKIPACGISIGFERIISILLDCNYNIDDNLDKTALLLNKDLNKNDIIACMKDAMVERKKGNIVNILKMAKNKKFQINNLNLNGFMNVKIIDK